jgi:predicted AlkP superfamily pyrophosphatase or phosphodiesterase
MTDRDMRFFASTVCETFGLRRPRSCETGPSRAILQSLRDRGPLIAVVFDGFGIAAMENLSECCPNFRSIAEIHYREVRAVPPPKTPVNFATMATGALQPGHGVLEKTNPLQAETLFEVFSESGLLTCVAGRQSGSPAHLFSHLSGHAAIAASNRDSEVLSLALEVLGGHQPSFTMLQLLDIDNAGHSAGPFGEEASRAIRETDGKLGIIMGTMAEIGGSVMALADHGQHDVHVDVEGVAATKGKHDGTSADDFRVPLAWANPDELSELSGTVVVPGDRL